MQRVQGQKIQETIRCFLVYYSKVGRPHLQRRGCVISLSLFLSLGYSHSLSVPCRAAAEA